MAGMLQGLCGLEVVALRGGKSRTKQGGVEATSSEAFREGVMWEW